MGGLLEDKILKMYSYDIQPREDKEVFCSAGFVCFGIKSTNSQAHFILNLDGLVNCFFASDSKITNDDNATLITIKNGTRNNVRIINHSDNIQTIFLSVHCSGRK